MPPASPPAPTPLLCSLLWQDTWKCYFHSVSLFPFQFFNQIFILNSIETILCKVSSGLHVASCHGQLLLILLDYVSVAFDSCSLSLLETLPPLGFCNISCFSSTSMVLILPSWILTSWLLNIGGAEGTVPRPLLYLHILPRFSLLIQWL